MLSTYSCRFVLAGLMKLFTLRSSLYDNQASKLWQYENVA